MKERVISATLAVLLLIVNLVVLHRYGLNYMFILKYTPVVIGWIVINLGVLFLVARDYYDLIMKCTNFKPGVVASILVGIYTVIDLFLVNLNGIVAFAIIMILVFTQIINSTIQWLYKRTIEKRS
ncbi:MAG: hypothetical protein R3Y22_08055 [Bacteroidales bacterium]